MAKMPGLMKAVCFLLFVDIVFSLDPQTVTVHGNWSPWSKLETACVKIDPVTGATSKVECGGGVKIKRRSCTNPSPQGVKPKYCEGPSQLEFPCNLHPCNLTWGEFGECDAKCKRGFKRAVTLCTKEYKKTKAEMTPCSEFPGFEEYDFEWITGCNTWNRTECDSPCASYQCQDFAKCEDLSTDEDAKFECRCQMGRMLILQTGQCVLPPPIAPTPRPIPTLAPAVKSATTAVTKSASTLLIIFVGITLFLFMFFRIYDIARVIQMNMEIALICAHLCLLAPDMTEEKEACRILSILIHLFFTACFMFMFLESLHVYAMVASVVPRDGFMNRTQNMFVGWGISIGMVLVTVALEYEHYGGEYHCWLQMDTSLVYAQLIPITVLVVLIFTMIEAAGNANYATLPGDAEKVDQGQMTSAKIMQRTNVLIMPLVYATFICGTLSEYEQNVPLYGIFTVLNGILGGCILVLHSSSSVTVRSALKRAWRQMTKD